MKLPLFDQSRKNETFSFYKEAVALSNELRAIPANTKPITNLIGVITGYVPARAGFDIETCDITDIQNWLNDPTKKKSQSLLMFVHRVMAVRFDIEYTRLKDTIDSRFNREHERVETEKKNEVEWFGEVSVNGLIRLDGSLDNPKARALRQNNSKFTIVRK